MNGKLNVLFLCTGNSCRSQMAEGWARHLKGDVIEAYSAGIETHGLNPNAVKVMAEAGVDISAHKSQHIDEFKDVKLDVVVTVCGHANENCPFFPGKVKIVHAGFEDPPKLARELAEKGASEEEQLDCYRRVRDQIREYVSSLPGVLGLEGAAVMPARDNDEIRARVRERYAGIASKEGGSCCKGGGCCSEPLGDPAASSVLGYSEEEMDAVPEGANMGLGCGNPQAIAALEKGQTVLDLGCGGGFDCFLAARRVGSEGYVIGVDMTPEMVSKARAGARKAGYANVDFRLGEIEHLPVADATADVIISNCVLNLSPDKEQVFREAFRVLRPGGRLAVSDVVAVAALPESVASDMDAYSGCLSGAVQAPVLERMLKATGFAEVSIRVKEESREFIRDWFPGSGVENYVRSAVIAARKS